MDYSGQFWRRRAVDSILLIVNTSIRAAWAIHFPNVEPSEDVPVIPEVDMRDEYEIPENRHFPIDDM